MKEIMTVEEVAEILKIAERTVRNAINDGSLKAYKRFGKWYVLASDLVAFIKAGTSK